MVHNDITLTYFRCVGCACSLIDVNI